MHPSYSETGFDDCAFLDYENMSNLYLYETGVPVSLILLLWAMRQEAQHPSLLPLGKGLP